jgi:S-methylmethionine-dependent homocysteine/selenocysteine methylase
MGTELQSRGVEVPSHITSIWSALALLDDPEAVVAVHRDYIDAGADVITINNYAVTPPLLARSGLESRVEELTGVAIDLARRAIEESGREVRLAGSLPPLDTSYRHELVATDAELFDGYRRIAGALAGRVDVVLCETLSCIREANAALRVARETDHEVWLSWTLRGDLPDRLPSGEQVGAALDAAREIGADAYLVNCCGANFATRAIEILAAGTDARVGAYANALEVTPGDEAGPRPVPEALPARPLDEKEYADAVARWLEAGARIVGGCCRTRPANIARLRALIDRR